MLGWWLLFRGTERNGTDGLRAARLAYYFARICNGWNG